MEIYETNNGTALDSNLVSGDEVVFNDLANKTWTGSVRVYRLGSESSTIDTKGTDAIQVYNLVVRLQPDSDTEITYVRVDDTIADIEGNAINAVLPVNKDTGAPTERDDLSVVIYTGTSVESVTVDGELAKPITDEDDLDYDASRIAWKITGVNIETMKVITVVAEDGTTSEQYTITTEIAQRYDDASITHFSIGDYDGVITNSGGANTPDVITVTVPYMTLDVADLRVYATPSSGAKVQFTTNATYDLINGYHTASRIGLGGEIDVTDGISTTIVAVDKNDKTVRQEYVVNVVLDKPAATGNRLEGLHFTAQPITNDSDRDIMHAIDEDENVFTANVWENTDSSNNVGTINLKVAPSLMDNREGKFNNVVTDFTTVDGGVAFVVYGEDTGNYRLHKLTATTTDVDDENITGSILSTTPVMTDDGYHGEYSTVIVLPEEIARQVLVGDAETSGRDKGVDLISKAAVAQYGTTYGVQITADLHSSEDDLISFTVGNTELTVNTSNNTISGVLPWSATVDQGEDATDSSAVTTWELSKYAKAVLVSNPDYIGKWDAGNAADETLYFVRNDDHTVTVMRSEGNKAVTYFEVQAEDRLTVGTGSPNPNKETVPSYTDWTFNLTWKDACDDADFESFSINGVNGVIDDSDPDNRTITVNLPFASDVTGLVAEFETSPEATVTLTTPDGVLVESGVTSINYTNTVLLYVHSESGENVNSYKVTVNLGSHFSDIDEDDWYYDNVMDAADNGYISGMGDGTFNPMGSTTRAQFASMIANAMGYEADPEAPSMFRDVADDFWGKAAINFCVQNGILTGYEDGSFQPNKAITRQEAASILRNAFELTETTSELFPDDSAIAGWAKESVYLVKASGLMKGDAGTGNFRPTSTITRAEAASILMNAKYAGVIN